MGLDPIVEARRQWVDHGWPEAADGMAAVTSVMRAQQILQARVDAVLRPFDLTFARYELLMLLVFSRAGRLPMSKVSARLQVHPTSVTNAADRLQQADLIRREPHPGDRRVTLVAVTPAGRRLGLRATRALNRDVFGDVGIGPDRVRSLVDLLTDLRAGAGDLDP